MSRKSLVPIVLPADPTAPLEAATKQYVDAKSAGASVEEVFVGPGDPGAGFELWYDNDAVPPAAPGTAVAPEVFIGPNDPGVTFALWYDTDAPSVLTTQLVSRNLLNNGQFAVAQRSTASVALTGSGNSIADRWVVYNQNIGTATLAFSTLTVFGVAPPTGRPRPANIQYVSITAAEAAGALAAADYMQWNQAIEGLNLQHLGWGTAGAQPVTVSFDCYSSVAATYVCELFRNEATQRTIAKTFTVPAGFSTVVLTFPGDTTTLVTNDTTTRLTLIVWIGAGSSFTSSPLQTTWGNALAATRVAGISNTLAATNGNIFALTNVQVEPGSQATPYEARTYPNELHDCQRYFERVDSSVEASYMCFGSGMCLSATGARYYVPWKRQKRVQPTVTYSAANTFGALSSGGAVLAGTVIATRGASRFGVDIDVTVASGLAAGQASLMYSNNVATATIDANAEI